MSWQGKWCIRLNSYAGLPVLFGFGPDIPSQVGGSGALVLQHGVVARPADQFGSHDYQQLRVPVLRLDGLEETAQARNLAQKWNCLLVPDDLPGYETTDRRPCSTESDSRIVARSARPAGPSRYMCSVPTCPTPSLETKLAPAPTRAPPMLTPDARQQSSDH